MAWRPFKRSALVSRYHRIAVENCPVITMYFSTQAFTRGNDRRPVVSGRGDPKATYQTWSTEAGHQHPEQTSTGKQVFLLSAHKLTVEICQPACPWTVWRVQCLYKRSQGLTTAFDIRRVRHSVVKRNSRCDRLKLMFALFAHLPFIL